MDDLTYNEFLTDLMEIRPGSAVVQLFIMDAVFTRAMAVAEADPADFDIPMVNGKAWVNAARLVRDRMQATYGKPLS